MSEVLASRRATGPASPACPANLSPNSCRDDQHDVEDVRSGGSPQAEIEYRRDPWEGLFSFDFENCKLTPIRRCGGFGHHEPQGEIGCRTMTVSGSLPKYGSSPLFSVTVAISNSCSNSILFISLPTLPNENTLQRSLNSCVVQSVALNQVAIKSAALSVSKSLQEKRLT